MIPFLFVPTFRAFDSAGNPLAGGLLYTYAANTLTPQTTWSDAAGTSPNTNPVVLDSTGSATVRLSSAAYKFVLKDLNGTTQWTQDYYQASYLAQSDIGGLLYPQTAAESAAPLAPVNYAYEPGGSGGITLNIFRFMTSAQRASVIAGDGLVDHTAVIQAANDFLEARSTPGTGGQTLPGGTLFFPCGGYNVNSTTSLRIGGHVRWLGDGHYGSYINVNDTTGNVPVVVLGPDNSGLFAFSSLYTMYSSIENFRFSLQGNNQRSALIYSANAQDGSYVKRIQMYGVNQSGISIDQCGDMFTVDDIQVYGGNLEGLPLPRTGVRCGGGGMMAVRNFIIAGQSGHNFVAGIRPRGGGMKISAGMFERCTDGVACLDTDAPAQGNSITVADVLGTGNVTNTVHIGTGFPSTVTCLGVNGLSGTAGAPIAIKNDNTGEAIANSTVGFYSWSGDESAVQASAFGYSAVHNTPHINYGKSATQSIAQNTLTLLTFPTKVDDWKSVTEWSGSRFTPNIPGRYRVTVRIAMASTTWAAAQAFGISIKRTGAVIADGRRYDLVGTFIATAEVNTTVFCGAGDYIEAYVTQGATATLNTDSSTGTCYICIDRE